MAGFEKAWAPRVLLPQQSPVFFFVIFPSLSAADGKNTWVFILYQSYLRLTFEIAWALCLFLFAKVTGDGQSIWCVILYQSVWWQVLEKSLGPASSKLLRKFADFFRFFSCRVSHRWCFVPCSPLAPSASLCSSKPTHFDGGGFVAGGWMTEHLLACAMAALLRQQQSPEFPA